MKVDLPYIDQETIRITKNGQWLSNGEEITHQETVRAYARHLGHDAEGWFIEIGKDFKRIEVEDTAYFVNLVRKQDDRYEIRLNDDSTETLDLEKLAYRPGRLTARVKVGGFEARFLPQPYHELLQALEEDENEYFFVVGTHRITFQKKP